MNTTKSKLSVFVLVVTVFFAGCDSEPFVDPIKSDIYISLSKSEHEGYVLKAETWETYPTSGYTIGYTAQFQDFEYEIEFKDVFKGNGALFYTPAITIVPLGALDLFYNSYGTELPNYLTIRLKGKKNVFQVRTDTSGAAILLEDKVKNVFLR